MSQNTEYIDTKHFPLTPHWVTEHADDMSNVKVLLNVAVDCTDKLVSVSQRYQRNGTSYWLSNSHQETLRVPLSGSEESGRWSDCDDV